MFGARLRLRIDLKADSQGWVEVASKVALH
jgi:hypothetical protein